MKKIKEYMPLIFSALASLALVYMWIINPILEEMQSSGTSFGVSLIRVAIKAALVLLATLWFVSNV